MKFVFDLLCGFALCFADLAHYENTCEKELVKKIEKADQCDQISLLRTRPNCSQAHFLPKSIYRGRSRPEIRALLNFSKYFLSPKLSITQ
jgi:hypothetical protein